MSSLNLLCAGRGTTEQENFYERRLKQAIPSVQSALRNLKSRKFMLQSLPSESS